MIEALILILLAPMSAPFAGLSVWVISRNEAVDDGTLLVRFLLILSAWMLLIWGLSHLDSVRFHIDPEFRISTQLAQHPISSTIERLAPNDSERLTPVLAKQLIRGVSLEDSFIMARPLLAQMATKRLGFADQTTHLAWGRSTLDTLKALQTLDPAACYRAIATKGADPTMPLRALSQANNSAFQEAVVAVYESANEGMRHDRSGRDSPVDLTQIRREYSRIRDEISERFGKELAEQLSKTRLAGAPREPLEEICAARIFELEAILKRPPPIAARLIDAVLR